MGVSVYWFVNMITLEPFEISSVGIFMGARYGQKHKRVRIWLNFDALGRAGGDLTCLTLHICLFESMIKFTTC